MKKIILMFAIAATTILSANAQEATKVAFNNFLKSYFDTKNALAKDDVATASVGAKNLIASIDKFPVKSLSASQQAVWNAETGIIKKAATAISGEKALKTQRNSFWAVSTSTLKLTKSLNLNSNEVYVQYCPMAKKSWLNEVAAVQNPFYGSMMYDCGEVSETIAKK